MATAGSEEKNAFTFLWKMENVTWLETIDTILLSPYISSRSLGKFMRFIFSTNSSIDDKLTCIELFIDDDPFGFPIDCYWSFVGSSGSTLFAGNVRNLVLQPMQRKFRMPDSPTHKEVFVTRKSEFLPNDTLTLRFSITKSNGDLPDNEFYSCLSRINTLECSFLWPVLRFNYLKLNEEVTTPVPDEVFESETKFEMMLTLKGKSLRESEVNVELIPVSFRHTFFLDMQISILTQQFKVFKCRKSERKHLVSGLSTSKESLKLPDFVSRKDLIMERSDCLKEDTLTLHCKLHAFVFNNFIEEHYYGREITGLGSFKNLLTFLNTNCQTPKRGVIPEGAFSDGKTSLSEDFLNLYRVEDFTDFTLQSCDDVSFAVHKNILAARSPVFKAMLYSNIYESNCLVVPDMGTDTLHQMLIFMYTGSLEEDLDWDCMMELYNAADKYQI